MYLIILYIFLFDQWNLVADKDGLLVVSVSQELLILPDLKNRYQGLGDM